MSDGMRSGVNCIRATFRAMACASARTKRLAQPGDALDEHMPCDQQRNERLVHRRRLTDEGAGDLGSQLYEQLAGARDGRRFIDHTGGLW